MRIQNAGRALTLNGPAVWDASYTSDSLAVMNAVFAGLSGQTASAVLDQFKLHVAAHIFMLTDYAQASTANAYYVGDNSGRATEYFYGIADNASKLAISNPLPTHSVDFYGTPLMPIAAIGYWLYGSGADRYVHIESLNLQMVVSDFSPITEVLNSATTTAGSYAINKAFTYNVFSKTPINLPAAGMLGRVSGNVQGTLAVAADGTYSFTGQYTLNDDLYDAGTSNRTPTQEALTTFLRALGDTFGHTDYTIKIMGAKSITFSGSK
jgi:hypothetical protein